LYRIPNLVSDLVGVVSKYVFFEGEHVGKFRKIRTSPQPGPRNAWIGNPHHRNYMVEVGT
jgi:hypothetical protein